MFVIDGDREEETVDNEGLGRKSSKRCCIFHKQRDFGESSTDSSDDDDDDDGSDSSSSGGPPKGSQRKIARPKQNKKPSSNKDAQRYHA
jgi:protein phosphatase 1 regulatory subunit 11